MKKSFKPVATIRDPIDGEVIALVTAVDRPGYRGFSFALYKEFQRSPGSEVERTSYLNERHLDAVLRVIKLVEECIARKGGNVGRAQERRQDA
jgi:hypothetical protein